MFITPPVSSEGILHLALYAVKLRRALRYVESKMQNIEWQSTSWFPGRTMYGLVAVMNSMLAM